MERHPFQILGPPPIFLLLAVDLFGKRRQTPRNRWVLFQAARRQAKTKFSTWFFRISISRHVGRENESFSSRTVLPNASVVTFFVWNQKRDTRFFLHPTLTTSVRMGRQTRSFVWVRWVVCVRKRDTKQTEAHRWDLTSNHQPHHVHDHNQTILQQYQQPNSPAYQTHQRQTVKKNFQFY